MNWNQIIIYGLIIESVLLAWHVFRLRTKNAHYYKRATDAEYQISEESKERARLEEQAGANAQELENWFNSYKNGELAHVRTDKFGNKWFAFTDPKMLPPRRGLLAELAGNYVDINITRESMLGYIERMMNNANGGNITAMFADLERIKERLMWACEEETLLQYAKVYFMLEHEPIEKSNLQFSKKKDEILRTDPETRDFFLYRAFTLTKAYSDISEDDFLKYLEAQRVTVGEESRTITKAG